MNDERLMSQTGPSLNVASAGAGAPIVLLHGVLRSSRDFSTLVVGLEPSFQVVAPDLRGHGRSDRSGEYFVRDYVPDVVELLETHLQEPAVLFGHSLGAMLALAAAGEVPGRVRAIVLEDPPFETMGNRIAEAGLLSYFQQLRELAARRLNVDALAQQLAEVRLRAPGQSTERRLGDVRDAPTLRFSASCLAEADPATLAPIVAGQWLQGFDWRSLAQRVQCPVLLLQGDPALGSMLVDADATYLCETLNDCTLVRCEQAGHHIHSQQPEWTLQVLQDFLNALATRPGVWGPSSQLKVQVHENGSRHDGHSQRAIG